MAKNPGKMALYEAIGHSRGRLINGNKPVDLSETPDSKVDTIAEPVELKGTKKELPEILTKVFPVDFLTLLIAAAIVFVLLIAAFKVGQATAKASPTDLEENVVAAAEKTALQGPKAALKPVERVMVTSEQAKGPAESPKVTNNYEQQGDKAILITRYMIRRDLEPVQKHFKDNGIEVEIIKKGNNYLLVSKKRYTDGFKDPSSKAYGDLRAIKQVGKSYEAPKDYEPFGSEPFQDAYGTKIE